jgi:hypothetical protein
VEAVADTVGLGAVSVGGAGATPHGRRGCLSQGQDECKFELETRPICAEGEGPVAVMIPVFACHMAR